jgi:hypothetical protein
MSAAARPPRRGPERTGFAVHALRLTVVVAGSLVAACWAGPIADEIPRDHRDRPAPEGPLYERQPGSPSGDAPDDADDVFAESDLPAVVGPAPLGRWRPPQITALHRAEASPFAAVAWLDTAEGFAGGAALTHVTFVFRTTADDSAKLALLEMCARCVADGIVPTAGASLRTAVANAGGVLTTEVRRDALVVSFSALTDRLDGVLTVCGAAFSGESVSPDTVLSLRQQALNEIVASTERSTAEDLLDRLADGLEAGASARFRALRDTSTVGVAAMLARTVHPQKARVLVAASGPALGTTAKARLEAELRPWIESAPPQLPSQAPTPADTRGVFVARPTSGNDEIVLSLRLPPLPPGPEDAARRAAVEWVFGSGADGALRDELRRALPDVPEWRMDHRLRAGVPCVEMRRYVDAGTVRVLDRAFQDAVQRALDTLRSGTGATRLQHAVERARLRLLEELSTPKSFLTRFGPDAIAGADSKPATPLDPILTVDPGATLAALDDVASLPIQRALTAMRNAPLVVLALDAPPFVDSQTEGLEVLTDLDVPRRLRIARATPTARGVVATEVFEKALFAVGGPDALRRFTGFEDVSRTRTGRGPEMLEERAYALDGRVRRVREVVSTKIETRIDAEGKGVQVVTPLASAALTGDPETVLLDDADVVEIRASISDHPLLLLRTWLLAGGAERAQWRLVSIEEATDQRLVLVERRSEDDRTWERVGFDARSFLPRLVEQRTVDVRSGDPVVVRTEWRDWRDRGVLRVPFHRLTFIQGSTEAGTRTVWESFQPGEPPESAFAPE